jgi:chromate reductase, NAD(P)H dehydrogenase (quinone)
MADVNILGFAGSLRRDSYNRALLREAQMLTPEGVVIEIFDLDGIPPYNADLESDMPSRVKEFKERIRAADALLIVTPEYNYSVPGVLKNAIDWASRPPADNPFSGKWAAIMSASTGMLGGSRAQYHLRQTFVYLNMTALNKPEVIVSFAKDKFKDGRLADETAKGLIRQLLANLADKVKK